jgi:hypothetical protein
MLIWYAGELMQEMARALAALIVLQRGATLP